MYHSNLAKTRLHGKIFAATQQLFIACGLYAQSGIVFWHA